MYYKLFDRLAKFRWIIPAKDLITLKMKFISDEVGQIDQVYYVYYVTLLLSLVSLASL